jgi:hypothetical protein
LEQLADLKQTVKLLSNVIQNKELTASKATGLLQVITDYTYALDTLDRYDYQQLVMVTSGLQCFYSCGFWRKTAFYIGVMVRD